MQDFTGWSRDLRVTADGDGVVSLAGAVPLRMLAERSGLTGRCRRCSPGVASTRCMTGAGYSPTSRRVRRRCP